MGPHRLVLGIAVAGCALIAAVATIIEYRFWTRRLQWSDQTPVWWPYGEEQFQAYLRALPSILVVAWSGVAIGVATLVLPPVPFGSGTPPLESALLILLGAGLVTAITTAAFNRPKFLVPPHLRTQPGLFGIWLEGRHR